jgi:hypothetical protein
VNHARPELRSDLESGDERYLSLGTVCISHERVVSFRLFRFTEPGSRRARCDLTELRNTRRMGRPITKNSRVGDRTCSRSFSSSSADHTTAEFLTASSAKPAMRSGASSSRIGEGSASVSKSPQTTPSRRLQRNNCGSKSGTTSSGTSTLSPNALKTMARSGCEANMCHRR